MNKNLSIQSDSPEIKGNNPTLIITLLTIIIIGSCVLGFLLYRQSQEQPILLDEVVESIDLPN